MRIMRRIYKGLVAVTLSLLVGFSLSPSQAELALARELQAIPVFQTRQAARLRPRGLSQHGRVLAATTPESKLIHRETVAAKADLRKRGERRDDADGPL
jgi:hypothetical protein